MPPFNITRVLSLGFQNISYWDKITIDDLAQPHCDMSGKSCLQRSLNSLIMLTSTRSLLSVLKLLMAPYNIRRGLSFKWELSVCPDLVAEHLWKRSLSSLKLTNLLDEFVFLPKPRSLSIDDTTQHRKRFILWVRPPYWLSFVFRTSMEILHV